MLGHSIGIQCPYLHHASHEVTGPTFLLVGLQGGFAEIGGEVGYMASTGGAPDGGVKWSDSADHTAPATFGTAATPTDFGSIDGGTLYAHFSHQDVLTVRSAPVRQAVAPSVTTPPVVSGTPLEGGTLTCVAATFAGPALSESYIWQQSDTGTGGWSDTGVSTATSPLLALGQFYRVRASAENTRGSLTVMSESVGPVEAVVSGPTTILQSVEVGVQTGTDLPVTIVAADAPVGAAVFWELAQASDGQVIADNTGAPLTWPSGTISLPPAVLAGDYTLTITVSDSAPMTSATFTLTAVTTATNITYLTGAFTVGAGVGQATTRSLDVDLSGHDDADEILVVLGTLMRATGAITSLTLGGVSPSTIVTVPSVNDLVRPAITYAVFPAGTYADTVALVASTPREFYNFGAAIYAIPAGATVATLTEQGQSQRAGSDVSGDVPAGAAVVAIQNTKDGAATTWTGVTEDYEVDIRDGEWLSIASANNVSAETPRVITTTGINAHTTATSITVLEQS